MLDAKHAEIQKIKEFKDILAKGFPSDISYKEWERMSKASEKIQHLLNLGSKLMSNAKQIGGEEGLRILKNLKEARASTISWLTTHNKSLLKEVSTFETIAVKIGQATNGAANITKTTGKHILNGGKAALKHAGTALKAVDKVIAPVWNLVPVGEIEKLMNPFPYKSEFERQREQQFYQ